MKDRNNAYKFRFDVKINRVFVEDLESCHANAAANEPKPLRIFQNQLKCLVDFKFQPISCASFFIVIPFDRVLELYTSFQVKDYLPRHARLFSSRSLSSALTCSQGTPAFGFLRRRSARFSSSAILSGGKSVSSSPAICRATSYCSSNGRRLNWSRISCALICSMYLLVHGRQADSKFRPVHNSQGYDS